MLQQGEPFFFLVKNDKGVKTEREVLGMAIFERFEVNSVNKAWAKYSHGNGDESMENFITRMEEMFKRI